MNVVYPSIHIAVPLAPLCSFTFSHTPFGGTVSSSFLFFGHSHFLCPSFPYLKHHGFSSTTTCFLSFFTPKCITQLPNASNLLAATIFFFYSSPLLYLRVRCPNPPHLLHSLPSLPSNSTLSLARACLWLSISLMRVLYCSRDLVLCSNYVLDRWFVKKRNLYFLRVRRLLLRTHSTSAGAHKSSPSQMPTALLTTALIILWLSLQGGDPYTNCLLKDVTIFLCID